MREKLIGTVAFRYINWNGEESERRVLVEYIYYGSTHYHEEQQWLCHGFDLDKMEWRTFAMKDISNLKSVF